MPPEPTTTSKPAAPTAGAASIRRPASATSTERRAYLYGLMAGGRAGVDRVIEILSDEIVRTMKLLGVKTLDELEPGHVTRLRVGVP